MKSDFNHVNRVLFSRQSGFCMEENKLISPMKFGSRLGKQCISAILHKVITYDIICHMRETAMFIKNNAVGCYDRMVNNLLILSLRRLGMHCNATQSLAQTWAQAIHVIRTQFGISEQLYSFSPDNPLFGPGQESTMGPFL
jgi:hypothetical protein